MPKLQRFGGDPSKHQDSSYSMGKGARKNARWSRWIGIAAAVFGIATVAFGAETLFGPEEFRSAAGTIVYFVLWFNFLAGFAYLVAAYGLFHQRPWTRSVVIAIASATAFVAVAFSVYAIVGGAFAWRTPGALLLRVGFWAAIAWVLRPKRSELDGRHA